MMEQQNNNEELDLVWLFKAFYEKCRKAKEWFKCKVRHALRFAWKKKIALTIAFLIGVGGGICQSVMENYFTKYTLESLAFLKTTSADVCDDLLESLNLFCKKKNYTKVAEMMGMVDENGKVTKEGLAAASKLKKVSSYFWIDDRHSGAPTEVDKNGRYLKDTSVVRIYDRLQVEIVTSELPVVDTIKNGLVHYLSTNEEVRQIAFVLDFVKKLNTTYSLAKSRNPQKTAIGVVILQIAFMMVRAIFICFSAMAWEPAKVPLLILFYAPP